MKIPEIVLKVMDHGELTLEANGRFLECPFRGFHRTYMPIVEEPKAAPRVCVVSTCGSWCPHFEVRPSGREVLVRLWCTPDRRDFGTLRVVEPEKTEGT